MEREKTLQSRDSPSVRATIAAEFVNLYEEAAKDELKKRQRDAAQKTREQLGRGESKDGVGAITPTPSLSTETGGATIGEMTREQAKKAGVGEQSVKRGRTVLKNDKGATAAQFQAITLPADGWSQHGIIVA